MENENKIKDTENSNNEDNLKSVDEKEFEATSAANNEVSKENNNDEDKFMAALSYLGILVLVPLLIKKNDEFVQFHAKQGLVLLVVWFVGMFLFMIPILGQLLALVILILNIVALVQALNGKRWEIPILGEYAKKIKL